MLYMELFGTLTSVRIIVGGDTWKYPNKTPSVQLISKHKTVPSTFLLAITFTAGEVMSCDI